VTAETPEPERLFYEPGASWAWLLAGPASAGTMLAIQLSIGYGWDPLMPVVFLVLVSGFIGIQVKAARIHTSVELTPLTLRQGVEVTKIADIVAVLPPAGGSELQKWESSRALGELTGVPRGRTGIGITLRGKRTAQAWARRHRTLREQLTRLVDERAS
jgi:hypothetical protein